MNSKVSVEQFRPSCCCKALHANKLISAVLQVPMFLCFLTLPRQEVCHHYVQSEPSAFPKPHANGGNKTHLPHLRKINHQFDKVRREKKSVTDFGATKVELWGNSSPIFGKSATDFGKIRHRIRENQPPTSGKSVTDFGEMSHRLWENEPPTLGK